MARRRRSESPDAGAVALSWPGKRAWTPSEPRPSRHLAQHGGAVDGWRNRVYQGDNLEVLTHLLGELRGQVDLVTIDPPFDSQAEYARHVTLRGRSGRGDPSFKATQYSDHWSQAEYLQFMLDRLTVLRELLAPTGAIYLHCDWRRSHLLRCLLDEVFPGGFQNEIVWHYSGWNRATSRYFNRRHDTILYYSKDKRPWFDHWRRPWPSKAAYVASRKQAIHVEEETGREFLWDNGGGGKRVKTYLEDALSKGAPADDVWKLDKINNSSKELTGYPTQKPVELLERIVRSSCPPGGLVLDCFGGSGTALVAAMRTGRRAILSDLNPGAVWTTVARGLEEAQDVGQAELIGTSGGLGVVGVDRHAVGEEATPEAGRGLGSGTVEAVIEGDELRITGFHHPELLARFGVEADDLDDWRRLVDTVLVDWSWDGSTLRPETVDLPHGNDLVSGRYPVIPGADRVRLVLVDRLSQRHVLDLQAGPLTTS